jgi:hypothetical protein
LLLVDLAPAARDFLGPLVNGDAAWPEADDGAPWKVEPDCCLNLSVIFAPAMRPVGARGVAGHLSWEVTAVAKADAGRVGDVGSSAPTLAAGLPRPRPGDPPQDLRVLAGSCSSTTRVTAVAWRRTTS